MTQHYFNEKIEAYNLAIECLRNHVPSSDEVDPEEARKIRLQLALKLDRECDRWVANNQHRIKA